MVGLCGRFAVSEFQAQLDTEATHVLFGGVVIPVYRYFLHGIADAEVEGYVVGEAEAASHCGRHVEARGIIHRITDFEVHVRRDPIVGCRYGSRRKWEFPPCRLRGNS